jgi:hypothetical protein
MISKLCIPTLLLFVSSSVVIETAHGDKGFVARPDQLTGEFPQGASGPEGDPVAAFDLTGQTFVDLEGDADNTILMLDIGAALGMAGMDVEVNAIGWNFTLTTLGLSWASEATIGFDWNHDLVNDVYLNASTTDAPVTMEVLSSGGPVSLASFGIPNGFVPGGVLRVELFDVFDDNPDAPDAVIDTGSLTIQIVPRVPVSGDFDQSGFYDCADIDALVMQIFSGANNPAFDLTGDGFVNLDDRNAWLAEAGAVNLPSGNPYLPTDFDLDGTVDGNDFLIWNANKFMPINEYCRGDSNADGVVDGLDFIEWNFFKFQSSDSAVQQIPEPQTLIGLLTLLPVLWRHRRD